jgi:flagellar biosynthesis protein FlhG
MNDQAEILRKKMMQKAAHVNKIKGSRAKTVAIVSGKGGVGKTNVSVNLAIGLAKLGKKVLLFDMDIGMGNIYHLISKDPGHSIADFFTKGEPLASLIKSGPEGIFFIHGGSAAAQLFEWDDSYTEKWIGALEELVDDYDYLLFDMGAGASKESLNILHAAEEVLTVTIPEPTAITDAYSMMKFIYLRDQEKIFYLICNRTESEEEGRKTAGRLKQTMETFLHISPTILGSLPEDSIVRKAITAGQPFTILYPEARVSIAFDNIVKKYAGLPVNEENRKTGFIDKLRRFFTERRNGQ